jgi:hypothetical protein
MLIKIFVGISEENTPLGRNVHSWERQCDILSWKEQVWDWFYCDHGKKV